MYDGLICTVMVLYIEPCIVVLTDAGLNESFELQLFCSQ